MKIKTLGPLALLCASCILAPMVAFAEGTITGVVINGFTGEPVRGATLTVEGTDISFKAGVGGDFRGAAPAGTYSVVVSRDGFESQRVTEVVVTDGGTADFAVVLLPMGDAEPLPAAPEPAEVLGEATEAEDSAADEGFGEAVAELGDDTVVADSAASGVPASDSGVFIGSITVEAQADDSTASALLAERKNAPMISDSIGTEEMKKSTGSDAADAVKRVTGISIQGDKYVYVRGLGERYSNTSLNGSKIPSTEFEKKVVPFDLFPSGLLDTIRVSKSYMADKPGDFAAGLVELETLDFPAAETFGVGFSIGHHSIATGNQFARYGGGLSWSGDGGQPLPAAIPGGERLTRLSPITGVGFTPSKLQEFGLSLAGTWRGVAGDVGAPWGGGSYTAPVDSGYNLSYGNTFGRLGVVVSGTYGSDSRARSEVRNFYRVSDLNENGIGTLHSFDIDYNTETVKKGMLANFAYRLSDNHQLTLRSLFNTLSRAETSFQEGFFSDLASDVREYEINYKNQEVSSIQLAGEHYMPVGALGSLLEWRASTSSATTDQDMRFSLYQSKDDTFILTDNSSSGFMFFNDLQDDVDDIGVDWTTFISGNDLYGSVKGGLATTRTDREFVGRRLRFKHRTVAGIDLSLPPEELFSEAYIRPDGFELEETTRPTDAYLADQQVDAAYAQLDLAVARWRFVGGVRYETSDINVVSQDIFNPEAEIDDIVLEDRDWLPSLAAIYHLTPKQNLRLSASQTVNRPEFRELAPFKFSDSVGFFERRGNPELVSADIRAYDLRWEWFPSSSDVVGLSLFRKTFDKPIESVIVEAVSRSETWINADTADNQGLEIELRRTLNPRARNVFTVVLNYSYIDSEITIPEGGIQTNPTRQMVGQPDQVGNLVLEWTQPAWGSALRLLYNYTGEKVAFAGANGLPDVLEEPVGTFDVAFRQQVRMLGLAWTFKISGENLTDEESEFTQGGELYRGWNPGTTFGLSIGLTFF